MSSIAVNENFGDLLDARVRKIYDKEYEENVNESMIPMLFGMESSTRNYEIVSGIGGMQDLQDFDGQIAYDAPVQLYDKTFYFPEKALGIRLSGSCTTMICSVLWIAGRGSWPFPVLVPGRKKARVSLTAPLWGPMGRIVCLCAVLPIPTPRRMQPRRATRDQLL